MADYFLAISGSPERVEKFKLAITDSSGDTAHSDFKSHGIFSKIFTFLRMGYDLLSKLENPSLEFPKKLFLEELVIKRNHIWGTLSDLYITHWWQGEEMINSNNELKISFFSLTGIGSNPWKGFQNLSKLFPGLRFDVGCMDEMYDADSASLSTYLLGEAVSINLNFQPYYEWLHDQEIYLEDGDDDHQYYEEWSDICWTEVRESIIGRAQEPHDIFLVFQDQELKDYLLKAKQLVS